MLSTLFADDLVLQAVLDDLDRISRTQQTPSDSMLCVQTSLLVRDRGCLNEHGADGNYGDETADLGNLVPADPDAPFLPGDDDFTITLSAGVTGTADVTVTANNETPGRSRRCPYWYRCRGGRRRRWQPPGELS